jgi:hypothetical protein
VISKEQIIPQLLEACPGFRSAWNEHVACWNGEEAGIYSHLSAFVHYLMSAYEQGHTETLTAASGVLERFLVDGDAMKKECAALGFIETLQNAASWKPYGAKVFTSYLEPASQAEWDMIERLWDDKTSLVDVILAKRKP